ncbi:SAM-dependent methyltransferase [Acidiplasma cupricumulans]|uniref:uroporphyrinogen-III C-methyltransferase n=1 Tax=Acidiplasma cupricumulans TaxID=312540 RepID=UPI000780D70F|nr:SAM-dependent methyltransferase [Acidiplasma cupricumulans]
MSSIRQNEINKIILDASNKFDITVRLKGGDPFLFGRGGEEAELLKENNIDFEVIPGVSALIAVPEYAGIPVTHRDVSHGIIAATGHNVEKLNIPSLGENKSSYTLIIFMGSKHINEIIDKLLFLGYSENTKIAVIENGTHKDQRVFTGTLKTINYEYSEDPALIVVGDVVSYHEKFGRKNNKFKKMLIFYEFKKINVDYENYGVNIINFRISDIFINNDVKFRFNRNLVISGNYIGYFMKLIKKCILT